MLKVKELQWKDFGSVVLFSAKKEESWAQAMEILSKQRTRTGVLIELFTYRDAEYCIKAQKELEEAIDDLDDMGIEIEYTIYDVGDRMNLELAGRYLKEKIPPIPLIVIDEKHFVQGYRRGMREEVKEVVLKTCR